MVQLSLLLSSCTTKECNIRAIFNILKVKLKFPCPSAVTYKKEHIFQKKKTRSAIFRVLLLGYHLSVHQYILPRKTSSLRFNGNLMFLWILSRIFCEHGLKKSPIGHSNNEERPVCHTLCFDCSQRYFWYNFYKRNFFRVFLLPSEQSAPHDYR